MSHCSYMGENFDKELQKIVIEKLYNGIKEFSKVQEFDAIAMSGNSSIIPGSILAYKLHKEIILVRKENEDNHSDCTVEFNDSLANKRYIIVDDFIVSGKTIHRILKQVHNKVNATCVGVFIYHEKSGYVRVKNSLLDDYGEELRRLIPHYDDIPLYSGRLQYDDILETYRMGEKISWEN